MSFREEGGLLIYDNFQEAQIARVRAWEGGNPAAFPLSFYANELFGEAGEAANVIKKLDREKGGAPGSRATEEQLYDELADIMICLRNLSIKAGCGEMDERPHVSVTLFGAQRFTLSDYSCRIGKWVGKVCDICSVGMDSETSILDLQSKLSKRIKMTAAYVRTLVRDKMPGFDLDDHTAKKWNATSLKVGLPHRIELPGKTLAETFA